MRRRISGDFVHKYSAIYLNFVFQRKLCVYQKFQLFTQSLTRKTLIFYETEIRHFYQYLKANLPIKTWITAVVSKNLLRSTQKRLCFRIRYHNWTANAFQGSYLMAKKLESFINYMPLDLPQPYLQRRPLLRRQRQMRLLLST